MQIFLSRNSYPAAILSAPAYTPHYFPFKHHYFPFESVNLFRTLNRPTIGHLHEGGRTKFPTPGAPQVVFLGSLSRDVFERPTSTGSELFSLLVCLDANKFVLLSLFSPLKTIYSRVSTKPLPNDAKSSLPVDVRRSKTLLLKLPIA